MPGAFEELYRAHAPRLFALACRLVGRRDAEDLLQDMFLTAHRKLDQFKGDSTLGTWLFRLGTNLCVDHLRRQRERFTSIDEAGEDSVTAGAAAVGPILGAIDRMDLERAVVMLPAGARTVFVLHDVEGFGHKEIAGILGVSEGTSKSQLHKARTRLRVELLKHVPVGEA
jgi:RNA polymerase sigma-70 factor (ECF subfamily)